MMTYKITDKEVDVYNENKHKLPCINCLVRANCFSEKQATKRAKYLRYTVKLNNPCPQAILIMGYIGFAAMNKSYLVLSLEEMDNKVN